MYVFGGLSLDCVLIYVVSDVADISALASVSKLVALLRVFGTARKFELFHCVGDDTLCGLVGLDSRLSKLLLARTSVGVDGLFEVGRSIGDLSPCTDRPSSDRLSISWSGSCDVLLGDLCTAEVSIVMVGARGRLAGPGEGDFPLASPEGGRDPSAIFAAL